jgi:hypothetical protein
MNLGLWTEPKAKNSENGTKNIDGLKITLDPGDESYDLIQNSLDWSVIAPG